jgi:hypothetical protein
VTTRGLPYPYRFCGYPQNLREFFRRFATCLHIAVIGNFIFIVSRKRCEVMGARRRADVVGTFARNPQGTRPGDDNLFRGQPEGVSMSSRPSEAAIDQIVASCNGDLHSALRALLLVNEQLEAELQQLYAAVALGGPFEHGSEVLH